LELLGGIAGALKHRKDGVFAEMMIDFGQVTQNKKAAPGAFYHFDVLAPGAQADPR
jgi:hypothetical protein